MEIGLYSEVQGVRVPRLIYGTAWKEDDTERLTRLAIDSGFRGVDTANQRCHYFEAEVGKAILAAFNAELLTREELFLQTKFTFVNSQDHRLPYDENACVEIQVEQSFESSLEHLNTEYLDSYLLHGPSTRSGLTDDDWKTWRVMESLYQTGKTRLLGISNVSIEQLEALYTNASVKPAIVQNRCYAAMGWDREVREYCNKHGLLYQGFSILTANQKVMKHSRINEIVKRTGLTSAQVIFCFSRQIGMVVLTGTKSDKHMTQDIATFDFELDDDDVSTLECLVG